MFIDTHCHLNFRDFHKDYKEVIQRALENDTWMIIVGTKKSNNLLAMDIAKQYEKGVYSAVGVHPLQLRDTEIEEFDENSGKKIKFISKAEDLNVDEYAELIKKSITEVPVQRSFIKNNAHGRVVAIGETGIDYYHIPEHLSKMEKEELINDQVRVFNKHIDLSQKVHLPLIVHCRGSREDAYGAYDHLLDILKKAKIRYGENLRGVIHCYGGNLEQAKEFIKLGFYIGFTGITTFDKTGHYIHLVSNLPIDRMLIETDSPYLTPEPYRGKRNEPMYVKRVAEFIAKTKGLTIYEVARITSENALNLFNLRY